MISTIEAGLTANELTNISVQQSFQPMQEGVNTNPTVYLNRVSDHRYGSATKTDTFDSINNNFVHKESQIYESVFQVTVLALQNPTNSASLKPPSALDIANWVAAILQSDTTIQSLWNSKVQILRVTDIRKPNFIDDKGRFEASPNFDFTVIHTQDIISIVPEISRIESGIYPIS